MIAVRNDRAAEPRSGVVGPTDLAAHCRSSVSGSNGSVFGGPQAAVVSGSRERLERFLGHVGLGM